MIILKDFNNLLIKADEDIWRLLKINHRKYLSNKKGGPGRSALSIM
jgi:hypothetical protein